MVGLPLPKTCHETIAMDLKERPHDKKVWLLRMIDQSRHQILIS